MKMASYNQESRGPDGRIYPDLHSPDYSTYPPEEQDAYEDRPCGCSTYSCRQENKERGNWTWGFEFPIASVSAVLGTGNIMRFPYLMYITGGAVFLIPFTVFMLLLGGPMLYLHMYIGQYSSNGILTCWEFFPILKGMGFAMLACSLFIGTYYSTLTTWFTYYLYEGFRAAATGTAPGWMDPNSLSPECNNSYASGVGPLVTNCNDLGANLEAQGGVCRDMVTSEAVGFYDQTVASRAFNILPGFSPLLLAETYFECEVTGSSLPGGTGLWELGPLRGPMAITCLVVYILVFLILIWGVKSMGKVALLTVPVSVVLMLVLFIRSATLDGAADGWAHYFAPDLNSLASLNTWKRAAIHTFYILAVELGVHITYSSYNRFHTDTFRHLCITWVATYVGGLMATLMIAGFVGFLAKALGVSVNYVTNSGIDLVFTTLPGAFTRLPQANVWIIMFYLTITLFALASLWGIVETMVTGIVDQFPGIRRYRVLVLFTVCCVCYLLQLPGSTNGGARWLTWMDLDASTWNIMIVCVLKCIAYVVFCFVSTFRFRHDVQAMTGWSCCCIPSIIPWGCHTGLLMMATPACLMFLAVTTLIDTWDYSETYPWYTPTLSALAWCLAVTPLVLVVIFFIVQLIYFGVKRDRRLVDVFLPISWRPWLMKNLRYQEAMSHKHYRA